MYVIYNLTVSEYGACLGYHFEILFHTFFLKLQQWDSCKSHQKMANYS
jgi:hypothetical protein